MPNPCNWLSQQTIVENKQHIKKWKLKTCFQWYKAYILFMALFGQSGWVDRQDFGHLLQQSNSWFHPFYKLCPSSHHNRWHRNYPIDSLSPTKGWPELISSIPSMTVNIDCQLEIINIQLCCHLTPNASFYFICSSSVRWVPVS